MKPLALFTRPPQPTVYEVRLEIDAAIVAEFDEWLPGHVREMLSLPGFQEATILRGTAPPENHAAVRLVRYDVRSRRELDSYLHTHAKTMRAEGARRFGKAMTASRRILPAAEYERPEGFTVLHDSNAISGGLPVCANCQQPVPGRFCMHCGQEDRTYLVSLTELLHDFAGDFFNFDSRFFRTLRPLLARPGLLTLEYARGRRQQYIPPVRMYIFASLIFFFAAALLPGSDGPGNVNIGSPDNEVVTSMEELPPDEREAVERDIEKAEELTGLPPGTLKIPGRKPSDGDVAGADDDPDVGFDEGFDYPFKDQLPPDVAKRLEDGARKVQEDPQQYADALLAQIPTVMFLFLPVVALILKLLYILSGRYYVEHLIFTLHFHSAVFVMLLFLMLYDALAMAWSALEFLSGWLAFALWLYIPYYLYKSLRTVYGQGRFMTVFKFVLLAFAYLFAVVLAAFATMLYTLYNQA